jgi:hypothetical protein
MVRQAATSLVACLYTNTVHTTGTATHRYSRVWCIRTATRRYPPGYPPLPGTATRYPESEPLPARCYPATHRYLATIPELQGGTSW